MKNTVLRLPFGVRDGLLIHISDAPSGLACNCLCPACGKPLVAKKGSSRLHHFAHARDANCAFAVETALHLAAKAILEQKGRITLPAVEANVYSVHHSVVLSPEQTYTLDRVLVERRVGAIIPDVLAYVRGRAIGIEVRVSHAVDESKLHHFRTLGLSAIEIDLSNAPRTFLLEELEALVVGPGPHKKWLFNAASERKREEILSSGRFFPAVRRGFAIHVDGCPIQARVWRGRVYANVVDDCICCDHALDIGSNMSSVTCGALSQAQQGTLFPSDS